jgi:hypothetical protein
LIWFGYIARQSKWGEGGYFARSNDFSELLQITEETLAKYKLRLSYSSSNQNVPFKLEMVVTLEVMKNRTVSNFHLLSYSPFKNKGGHS